MQEKDDSGIHAVEKDIGAVYTSPSFQIIDTSPGILEALGYESPDEMVGLDFIRHFVLDAGDQKNVLHDIEKDKKFDAPLKLECKDGTTINVIMRVFTLYDEEQHVTGYQFSLFHPRQEIAVENVEPPAEEKDTSQPNAPSRAFKGIVQILDGVPYPLMVLDENNLICVWNQKLNELTGINAESVKETEFLQFLPDRSVQIWQSALNHVREGEAEQCETEKPVHLVDRNGNILVTGLTLKRNNILGKLFITVIFHDWNRDADDAEKPPRRLTEIPIPTDIEVLRPVAKRFGKKLQAAGNSLADLKDQKLQNVIDDLFSSAEQLYHFSGMPLQNQKNIDLNALVKNCLTTYGTTGEKIRRRLDEKIPAIYGNEEHITHGLKIALQNALDTVEDPGEIEISTHMITGEDKNKYASVHILDNGPGFTPEMVDHLFTPFHSTKTKQGSGGLGLPALYGIVKSHGGFLTVKSGDGAVVSLFFPAMEEKDKTQPVQKEQRKTKILLMDDDEVIIDVNKTVLVHSGYDVLSALTTKEGLNLLQTHAHDISLVMIDGSLRGCADGGLLEKIRRVVPDMPVVVSSGHQKDRFAAVLKKERCGWLQKPHTSTELCDIVAEYAGR